jgi:tetratricopeptide (TPR) repeat protein
MVDVRENTREEVEEKLNKLVTPLTKIEYLESALKKVAFSLELKRFIWNKLIELYESGGMYDKAAKAISSRAGIDVTFKEKIDAYLKAAGYYAKVGRIDDSEDMFTRAVRESDERQKAMIMLTRKNVYLAAASDLERKGRKAMAGKFYEKLLKMKLDDLEKKDVKEKLINLYKSLGKFKEAELLRGV